MNVLVVGYGSIGMRHVRNLSNCNFIEKIVVYTKVKQARAEDLSKVFFVDSYREALDLTAERFDVAFAIIANETFKHIEASLILAEKGIHLLIEKPLSHNLSKVDLLLELIQKKNIKVMVAYNFRFLPAIRYLKEQIAREAIGRLYFAQIEVGQYLPSWRSNIYYADSYSSKKEYGGGVALDLSHELDYMRYLFGDPLQWKTLKSRSRELDINSEDLFQGIYKYNEFVCHVQMDYLQRNPKRRIRVVGSRGEIVIDLIGKKIEASFDTGLELTADAFNIEKTYVDELNHFVEAIKTDFNPCISVYDGIEAMKLLEDNDGVGS